MNFNTKRHAIWILTLFILFSMSIALTTFAQESAVEWKAVGCVECN